MNKLNVLMLSVAAIATSSAQAQVAAWGLTEQEWLTASPDEVRSKTRVAQRQAELVQAAEAGDLKAMTLAAGAYANGIWGAPNPDLAHKFAKQAAGAGDSRAMIVLGVFFQNGIGTMANLPEARAWFRRSHLAGNPRGTCFYAPFLFYGGTPSEKATATDLLRSSLDRGLIECISSAGWVLVQSPDASDRSEGLALLDRAVEASDPASMVTLAKYYSGQTGADPDKPTAFKWALRAAEAGSAEGMYWAGLWYGMGGYAGEKDLSRSNRWIRAAAEAGYREAIFLYAARLESGAGMPADAPAALRWYDAAAAKGHSGAMAKSGELRLMGAPGLPRDIAAAMGPLRLAAQHGSGAAMMNLGFVAEDISKNRPIALSWYRKAAATGLAAGKAEADRLMREDAQLIARSKVIEERLAAERAARAAAARARAASTAYGNAAVAPGAPSPNDILRAHAAASARYNNGQVTATPGEVAIMVPVVGVSHYERRELSGLSCSKLSIQSFRCSYNIKVTLAAPDNFFSAITVGLANMVPRNSYRWTYDFSKKEGGWYSAALDASMRQDALASKRRPDTIKPPEEPFVPFQDIQGCSIGFVNICP